MNRRVASDPRRLRRGELTPTSGGADAGWQGHMKLYDSYNNLGNLTAAPLEPSETMYTHLFPVLRAMAASARAHGAEFLLLLYPPRLQVQPRDWLAVVDRWQLNASEFDLDKHHRRILQFCDSAGIPVPGPRAVDARPVSGRQPVSSL
jgi:hypothetical protein